MKNTGIKKLFYSVALFGLAFLAMPDEADAQGRYVGRYSRADVDQIIRRLEEAGDQFRSDFRRAVDRSNLSNAQKRTYRNQVDAFENQTDRLRSNFDRDNDWWRSRNQVQNLIAAAQPLNQTMNTIAFRRQIERQWNQLRNNVNTLADTYDLPGIAGGGWTGGGGGNWPGGPGFPGGNVGTMRPPTWAQGTFYATGPAGQPIILTISPNGSVNASVGQSMTYGTFTRGNILNLGGIQSRVTRSGNGIVTTRMDIGERIVYTRNTPGTGYPGQGGGWGNPGWGGGNQISPPSWARGNFRGTAPNGTQIDLTISNNGDVSARIGGSTVYGSFTSGNYLTIDGIVSRVTRTGNGLTTTRLDNGETIGYRRR
jgi:hypothetical protein